MQHKTPQQLINDCILFGRYKATGEAPNGAEKARQESNLGNCGKPRRSYRDNAPRLYLVVRLYRYCREC